MALVPTIRKKYLKAGASLLIHQKAFESLNSSVDSSLSSEWNDAAQHAEDHRAHNASVMDIYDVKMAEGTEHLYFSINP
jgi:hypothetical protein